MIEDLKEKFELGRKNKTTRRVDEIHPLDIFVGYNEDGFPRMVITDIGHIKKIESSKSIDVKIYRKSSGQVSICFDLLNQSVYSLFLTFCSDMIDSTRNIKKQNIIDFITRSWDMWRTMFKKPYSNFLTENQIKGLIGELIFLKSYMIPKYGEVLAVESWMGPSMLHKDYEINNTWYELKSINSSSLTVKISSVEQLDSQEIGQLVIVKMDKTNSQVEASVTLNRLVNEIKYLIKDFDTKIKFTYKLSEMGYYSDEEYNSYNYKILDIDRYMVNKEFPKVTKDSLKDGIVRVSYEIALNSIEKYMIEGE